MKTVIFQQFKKKAKQCCHFVVKIETEMLPKLRSALESNAQLQITCKLKETVSTFLSFLTLPGLLNLNYLLQYFLSVANILFLYFLFIIQFSALYVMMLQTRHLKILVFVCRINNKLGQERTYIPQFPVPKSTGFNGGI